MGRFYCFFVCMGWAMVVHPTWTPVSLTTVSEYIKDREAFLIEHSQSIRGMVCDRKDKINTQLIDALPCLETVATSSVGVDKVDLAKSRQCNIAVVYTPDVLTDVVADLAIALVPDTLRRISSSDCYVRQGLWQSKGDYKLSCKVPHLQISSSVNKLEAGEG